VKELFQQYSDTVRLMGAAYEEWVLPNEIITTMNKVANPKRANVLLKAYKDINTAWKGWATSMNPLRTVKFGLRNFVGDLDAVIAGKLGIVKYAPRAVKEIYAAMKNKKYSTEFLEWTERGGFSSMIFANEMNSDLREKLFKHLENKTDKSIFDVPVNMLKGYTGGVEAAHNFRESILRYSAYLYFKDNINKNDGTVKDNVASNRYIVRGLKTAEDKAYQLSKDLLGAYDEISMMGQTLRRYIVPFYSFTESNFKRYFRMFENAFAYDGNVAQKAYKVMSRAFGASFLMLLMLAWNRLVKGEDDDKLPPSVRNIPHITLGSIGDDVYAFRQLGSFPEMLEWFGLDDFKFTKDDLTAPVDKAYNMITPLIKLPIVELWSGISFYPQLTKPKTIRDRAEYVFNSLGVDSIYRYVSGKPTQGLGEIAQNAVIYKYDHKQSALREIQDLKKDFQKRKSNALYWPDDKANALYYMKLAMKYKDQKAALKYLNQYFEYGGTGRGVVDSFASLNPMYGFTSKSTMEKGQEFVASLNDNERVKLKIAQDYFDRELDLPADIKELLKKKDISDVEAKNLLTKYVKSKIN
jgi:hypothetical protein